MYNVRDYSSLFLVFGVCANFQLANNHEFLLLASVLSSMVCLSCCIVLHILKFTMRWCSRQSQNHLIITKCTEDVKKKRKKK